MSWGNGSSGSGGGGGWPPDAGSGGDRFGQLRGRLAREGARLRRRALRLWWGRAEPDPLEGTAAPDDPPLDSASAGGHVRPGSLRSRLLWSFVGVAALAALIVGVVTLSLVRLASINGLEQQLHDQAEAASVTIGSGPAPCMTLAALRAVQTELYLVGTDGS